jgi:hypothetical protein
MIFSPTRENIRGDVAGFLGRFVAAFEFSEPDAGWAVGLADDFDLVFGRAW